MKIYDCFPFFNELELLEIRLEELWDSVDYFVIAEANLSHSGNPKEYIFENNKDKFSKYLDKIRYIKIDNMPRTNDPWVRERFQRASIAKGLYDLLENDIVIISDCDEIPRAKTIDLIKEDENNYDRYICNIPMFQYKINFMMIHPFIKIPNIIVTRGRVFTNPQQEREYTFNWISKPSDTVFLEHAGWHFSYFGDDIRAIIKIQNFAHTETNNPEMINRHNIDFFIENKCGHHGPKHPEHYEYVKVDDYFPNTIIKNLDKWQHMIIPGATLTVEDIYQ